jgi:hypothetical protein
MPGLPATQQEPWRGEEGGLYRVQRDKPQDFTHSPSRREKIDLLF